MVYRVFLAEEDAAVRESIRSSLAGEWRGFRLVGEASDGLAALPMIRDLRPDILIAGLRMPFMDGMALCGAVRRDFPWVQQMAIGGNDDLVYTKTLQEQGVGEYLLRPFNMYELREALERVAGRLKETRRSLRERIDAAESGVSGDRREAERRFYAWIHADSEQEFVHRMYLEKRSQGSFCRVLTVEPGTAESAGTLRGILRLLELEPDHCGNLTAFDMKDVLAVVVSGDDCEALEDIAYGMAYTVLSAAEYFTGVRPRIQVGACVDSMEALRRSFLALTALRQAQPPMRPVLGAGDALRLHPDERAKPCLLGELLPGASAEEIRAMTARFSAVDYLNAGHVREAVAALEREVGATCPPEPDGDLCAMLERAVRWRDEIAPDMAKSPLSRARCYVAQNFDSPGLQLLKAAACAGMTPNRFRQVFAQEIGCTFTEYLAELRVNAAKALLAGTRMRISGIARRTGYSDEKYFSNVFLHIVGMDPREYRRREGKA